MWLFLIVRKGDEIRSRNQMKKQRNKEMLKKRKKKEMLIERKKKERKKD